MTWLKSLYTFWSSLSLLESKHASNLRTSILFFKSRYLKLFKIGFFSLCNCAYFTYFSSSTLSLIVLTKTIPYFFGFCKPSLFFSITYRISLTYLSTLFKVFLLSDDRQIMKTSAPRNAWCSFFYLFSSWPLVSWISTWIFLLFLLSIYFWPLNTSSTAFGNFPNSNVLRKYLIMRLVLPVPVSPTTAILIRGSVI